MQQGERPIFIFSSGPRCGSTLLQRVLNSHPDVLIWGETGGGFAQIVRGMSHLAVWASHFDSVRAAYEHLGSEAFTAALNPSQTDIGAAAMAFFGRLWRDPAAAYGKSRWGAKEITCDASIAQELLGLYPTATIIHLTRDPVDCLISLLRWEIEKPRWQRAHTLEALAQWRQVNESFLAIEPKPAQIVSLRYEDMTADPRNSLAPLWTAADLEPAAVDFTVFDRRVREANPQAQSVSPRITRRSLSRRQRALIDDAVRDIAAAYDYRIDFDRP